MPHSSLARVYVMEIQLTTGKTHIPFAAIQNIEHGRAHNILRLAACRECVDVGKAYTNDNESVKKVEKLDSVMGTSGAATKGLCPFSCLPFSKHTHGDDDNSLDHFM